MFRHKPARRCAFTLIELLVVMGIVGVLVALILPLYGRVTQQAAETKTLSNMRQMGSAMVLFAGDNNSQLPGRVLNNPASGQPPADRWPKQLQPYVQDTRVYTSPIPDANGKSYRVTDPTKYFDNGTNYTSYIYNGFNDMQALAASDYIPRLNGIERPTSTILLGIPYPQIGQFYMDFSEGIGNNNDVLNRTAFSNVSVYLFCDGSARMLAYDSKTDQKAEPRTSGVYSDWYWLNNKANTDVIK